MEYPKINSLYKREPKGKRRLIEGDYACEEFDAIKQWYVSEKVDGSNARIMFDRINPNRIVQLGGRTDSSQFQLSLLSYLQEMFTWDKMEQTFAGSVKVTLFGEVTGCGIQGNYYGAEPAFHLFDAVIDGWWLNPDKLVDLSHRLEVQTVPSYFQLFSVPEIVQMAKEGFTSCIYSANNKQAEGIVARSYPQMMFRHNAEGPGCPIMFKLKHKDFATDAG